MQITDGLYIATDKEDFKWALDKLQHDDRVDWQSIRCEQTVRGCTPIWWELRGHKE